MTDKEKIRAEVERMIELNEDAADRHKFGLGKVRGFQKILSFIDSLPEDCGSEVDCITRKVWHDTDEVPTFGANGLSDLIIDSCYEHIEGEAHYYTPQQWEAHVGFQRNRQFKWAYEEDLFNLSKVERKEQDDPIPTIAYMDGVEEGKRMIKEQMVKDAVEGYVHFVVDGTFALHTPYIPYEGNRFNYRHNDKVKLFVIKEE